LRALAPDLVLVVTTLPATEALIERVRAIVPYEFRVAFFDFARDTFWLREPGEDAQRLRSLFLSLGLEDAVR
jgi:hypothetical protein